MSLYRIHSNICRVRREAIERSILLLGTWSTQLISRDGLDISIGVVTRISLGHRCFRIALSCRPWCIAPPCMMITIKKQSRKYRFRKKIGAQRERGGREKRRDYCRNTEMIITMIFYRLYVSFQQREVKEKTIFHVQQIIVTMKIS